MARSKQDVKLKCMGPADKNSGSFIFRYKDLDIFEGQILTVSKEDAVFLQNQSNWIFKEVTDNE